MYFTRSAVNKAKGLKRLNLGDEYIVSDIILYTFLYLSEIVHNKKKNVKGQLIGRDLMLGKIEGKRRRGQQRMRRLESITNSNDMNLSRLRETAKDRGAWCAAAHRVANCRAT